MRFGAGAGRSVNGMTASPCASTGQSTPSATPVAMRPWRTSRRVTEVAMVPPFRSRWYRVRHYDFQFDFTPHVPGHDRRGAAVGLCLEVDDAAKSRPGRNRAVLGTHRTRERSAPHRDTRRDDGIHRRRVLRAVLLV